MEDLSAVLSDEGKVVRYASCPRLFITESVKDFLERYEHMQKYPQTVPSFDEITPRFRAFVRYFERFEMLSKQAVEREEMI